MKKIIIDTDPGKDDFLAILMLLLSKKVDTLAITTIMGNSTIQNVTANAKYLLDLTSSSIPLFPGAPKPMKKKFVLGNVMGKSGLDGVTVPKLKVIPGQAIAALSKLITTKPGEIIILTLGPLTNIAQLIRKDSSITSKIRSIILMGGAISCPGNKNRVAEFNFFVDPDAAKVVMESNIPKIMIPLDLCYQLPFFTNDFSKLKQSSYGEIINQLMKPYIVAMAKYEDQPGAIIYDALAAYYLLSPKSFVLTPMDIVVETKGEFTSGMTVINRSSTAKPNILVATGINKLQFKRDFTHIINSA